MLIATADSTCWFDPNAASHSKRWFRNMFVVPCSCSVTYVLPHSIPFPSVPFPFHLSGSVPYVLPHSVPFHSIRHVLLLTFFHIPFHSVPFPFHFSVPFHSIRQVLLLTFFHIPFCSVSVPFFRSIPSVRFCYLRSSTFHSIPFCSVAFHSILSGSQSSQPPRTAHDYPGDCETGESAEAVLAIQ